MPDHSYYAGKSDLLLWVNGTLNLNVSSLDELANGAISCQIVDAHFSGIILMHKVNFRARKEYEIFANYKLLQASLNAAGFDRDLNIEGLVRGCQADILELLQWMFMSLKKRKPVPDYNAKARRKLTINGGTRKVPLPVWRSPKFDALKRPDSSGCGKRLVNSVSETEPIPRHSRAMRDTFNGVNRKASSVTMEIQVAKPPRSPIPGRLRTSTDHHPDPKYVPSPSPENRPPWRSPGASPIRMSPNFLNGGSLHLSPKGVSLPKLKLDLMTGGTDPFPSATTPNSSFNGSYAGKANSLRDMALSAPSNDSKASEDSAACDEKDSPESPPSKMVDIKEFITKMADIAPVCLNAGRQAASNVVLTSETIKVLMEQVGTNHDTYACRAKLHSLKDAMNTLVRHTYLLLGELGPPLAYMKEENAPNAEQFIDENEALMKRLEDGRDKFLDLIRRLAAKEEDHPVPKGTSASGKSGLLREFGEVHDLDGALRKVGAAKATLGRALQKPGIADLLVAKVELDDPEMDFEMEPLDVDLGVTEGIETMPADEIEGRAENIDVCMTVGHPVGPAGSAATEIYKGQYVGGKKCGFGTYTFVNGDVYQGEFSDDEMHGCGLYTFSHEGHYEGQWVMGAYEGVGTETFALGSTYHGQYTEGARNGWGVCRYYNGDYYEGQWSQGLREGRGMQQCTDDSNFVGDYLHGKRHGFGVYNFPNGDRYYGEYVNDIPHGHGVYRFSNGQKYEGQWRAGKKHGSCVYTVETSGIWERWAGEWKEGSPVWVESLGRWDNDISGIPTDLQTKMKKALDACGDAQDAGEIGMSRADEHWKTDGVIQRSIRKVVSKADRAAVLARRAQKSALEVATRLSAGEHRGNVEKRDVEKGEVENAKEEEEENGLSFGDA